MASTQVIVTTRRLGLVALLAVAFAVLASPATAQTPRPKTFAPGLSTPRRTPPPRVPTRSLSGGVHSYPTVVTPGYFGHVTTTYDALRAARARAQVSLPPVRANNPSIPKITSGGRRGMRRGGGMRGMGMRGMGGGRHHHAAAPAPGAVPAHPHHPGAL